MMKNNRIVLLAPHTRITKYINEVKRFLGNSDYTKIKNERIEKFRALLSEDHESLHGQLRGKIKKIVNHIIYTTCVGGISTTSAKSLSEIGDCSESTVYRAVKLIKESKQFIVGNENEYGKGRYIFVDTLCINYPIVMEYVFQLHETVYKSLAYDQNVQEQANHELSKVFGINKDDVVGVAIEQLSRSNRLGNYVSFYELKQYNQGLLKASDILGNIRSRIMSVLNLQKKAIEYQQPIIYELYDLMLGTTARLDLLESIPKIIVKLLQFTKDKPSIKDVLRTYKAYAEMAKNFAQDTKMMYQQYSLPRYFEVVYEAFKEKEDTIENSLKDVSDLSHDLGVVQEQVDSFMGVCRNQLKPKDSSPPKFYNWLLIRD